MIEIKNLVKNYGKEDTITCVIKDISFSVDQGEFLAIMGKSGAGKSTCMYQMSLLDRPTSGEIIIDSFSTHDLNEEERTRFRLNNFGFVFQDYALVPELTSVENVMLPLFMQGFSRVDAEEKAQEVLSRVHMEHRLGNKPNELSGGEQQRVSIARALVTKPKILFADEPTANLDNISSEAVMDIFKKLHKEGQTIIMVTHELEYAEYATRIITMNDGTIVNDKKRIKTAS